jgi:esterase
MELLHYRLLGEEQPESQYQLLVQHGLFGLSDNWQTVGRMLAQHYRTYLVDARNHGRSFWSEDMDYHLMAEDLYHLITALDIAHPVLVGHSMGGKAVMQFAADYPTLYDKLVVVDIAPRYYPPHHQSVLAGLLAADLATAPSRQAVDDVLAAHGHDLGTRQFLLKNLYRDAQNQFAWRMNLAVLAREIEQVGRPLEFTKPLPKPALFVRGSASGYIADADLPDLRRAFPATELATIAGAGHWVHADQPQALFEVLREFVGSRA